MKMKKGHKSDEEMLLATAQQEAQEKSLLEKENQKRRFLNWLRQDGHKAPNTRREFLMSGAMGFSAYLFVPSILDILLNATFAQAQDAGTGADTSTSALSCSSDGAASSDFIPFINVNLAGGAALMANIVPMNKDNDLLTTYNVIGLGAPSAFQVVREFGNVPFPAAVSSPTTLISQFLQGLKENATTAINKTAFVAMYVQSQDDTSTNQMSIAGLINAAGAKGSNLPFLGTESTPSGVRQLNAAISSPPPLVVRNLDTILGAISAGGVLASRFTTATQKENLARTIANLSESQRVKLARTAATSSSTAAIGNSVSCATKKNIGLAAAGTDSLDPRKNAGYASIWGINEASLTNNPDVVQASIVYNTLNQKSGAAGIDLGGYDYHGNSRTTTDAQDKTAGILVGRILKSAEFLNKPVFIHVSTDGSVGSQKSDTAGANFTGDRGTGGTQYILFFDPVGGRRETNGFQIGHFTNNQVADEAFMANWIPGRAAMAVFGNYLAVNNKMNLFNTLTNNAFTESEKLKIIKFST